MTTTFEFIDPEFTCDPDCLRPNLFLCPIEGFVFTVLNSETVGDETTHDARVCCENDPASCHDFTVVLPCDVIQCDTLDLSGVTLTCGSPGIIDYGNDLSCCFPDPWDDLIFCTCPGVTYSVVTQEVKANVTTWTISIQCSGNPPPPPVQFTFDLSRNEQDCIRLEACGLYLVFGNSTDCCVCGCGASTASPLVVTFYDQTVEFLGDGSITSGQAILPEFQDWERWTANHTFISSVWPVDIQGPAFMVITVEMFNQCFVLGTGDPGGEFGLFGEGDESPAAPGGPYSVNPPSSIPIGNYNFQPGDVIKTELIRLDPSKQISQPNDLDFQFDAYINGGLVSSTLVAPGEVYDAWGCCRWRASLSWSKPPGSDYRTISASWRIVVEYS